MYMYLLRVLTEFPLKKCLIYYPTAATDAFAAALFSDASV